MQTLQIWLIRPFTTVTQEIDQRWPRSREPASAGNQGFHPLRNKGHREIVVIFHIKKSETDGSPCRVRLGKTVIERSVEWHVDRDWPCPDCLQACSRSEVIPVAISYIV